MGKDLSYEDKFKKLLSMLAFLKEKNEDSIFYDLHEILRIWNGISENFVNTVYQILLDLMSNLDKKKMEKAVSKLEAVKDKMESIKEQEKNEDKEEGDVDELLEDL